MITEIKIPFHSFISLITNSSSEVFISVNDSIVETIHGIVNNALASQGVTVKSEDLIDITVEEDKERGDTGEHPKYVLAKAKDKKCKEAAELINKLNHLFTGEEFCT